MAEKCTKLIFAHSNSAKLNLGAKPGELKTLYTVGILRILLYRTPGWKKAIDKVSYKLNLVRVQRNINIKIAKVYRTVSSEAPCILTGFIAIAIKIEETCQFYELTKCSSKVETLVDRDVEVRYWHHTAGTINFLTENSEETSTFQICTAGSKSEQGRGAGTALLRSGKHIKTLKYRLRKDVPTIKPSS